MSDISIMGQRDYSMRIWVDPEQLAARNMTAGDVVRAIREQNSQVATGMIGTPPVRERPADSRSRFSTLGRLETPEQFEDIVVKARADGRLVRLKDVARVELGADNEDVDVMFDGQPTVLLVDFSNCPTPTRWKRTIWCWPRWTSCQASFPDGRGLGDRLRHHAVHPRIDQRGVQGAARRGHAGGDRGAGVPAELADRPSFR